MKKFKALPGKGIVSAKKIASKQSIKAAIYAPDLSVEDERHIRKLFDICNVDVVDEWNDESEYDGVRFRTYNISTGNMNTGTDQFNMDRLMDKLYALEDRGIGFEKTGGDNGFYSWNFEFYMYAD